MKRVVVRVTLAPVMMLAVLSVVFLVLHVLPGNPAAVLLNGAPASPQTVKNLEHYFGLDRSLSVQYGVFVKHIFSGNLGRSYVTGQPVSSMIGAALPSTLELASAALVISVLVGIGLGVLSAVHRGRALDAAVRLISQFGISVPSFWTGLILILIFSYHLRWFPSIGGSGIRGLTLPAVTLGLVGAGVLTRIVRNSVLETDRQLFVLQLHAKGLSGARVTGVHVLRNGFIAAMTAIGLLFAELLAGTVVIETVFSRAGVGRLLVTAITSRDIPVAQGTVIVIAGLYVFVNLAVDASYVVLDPRLRRQRHA